MNKWLLLLALPLSCAVGFLSSTTISASSIYDDAYQTTDSLNVQRPNSGNGTACAEGVDVSYDWAQYILQRDYNDSTWGGEPYASEDYGNASSSFRNAIDNGSWSASQRKNDDTYSVSVVWHETDDIVMNWGVYENGIQYINTSGNAVHFAEISCNYQSGGKVFVAYAGVSGIQTISNSYELNAYQYYRNYVFTGDPNYPSGYDGTPVRDSIDQPCVDDCVQGGNWQPSFDIEWDDLEITLTDKTPLDKIDEYNIDKCYWEVHDGNWDDLNLTGEYPCDDHTPVVYNLPTYESYQIGLNYYDSENGILYSAEYLVNIDGGSGSDSINDAFYSTAIGRVFKKHMDSDYGLEKFFLAPINFVASLPAKVNQCTPINYILMGENVQLNCLSTTVWNRPMLSTVVNLYQVILFASVTYFVAIGTYGVIKSATNPLDDKLEVLKL